MKNPKTDFFFSLVDQSAVSAGNFITIVLGAHFLTLVEQGKLIFSYTAYIGLVLFNVSAFFAVANIVRSEIDCSQCYKQILQSKQLHSALLTSALLPVALFVFQNRMGWQLTFYELLLLFVFLFFQQIADFRRRASYVFGRPKASAYSSVWLYGMRILGIAAIQPANFLDFLTVMALPTLLVLFFTIPVQENKCGKLHAASIFRSHIALSKWNILNAPFKWAGLHFPIMLVGILHSMEAAAILGSVRAITTFANVFLELLETFFPAWLMSKKLTGGQLAMNKGSFNLLYIGLFFWIMGAIAIWLFGDVVVTIILGAQYATYMPLLFIIWLGNGIYFLSRTMSLHYRLGKNTVVELIGSIASTIMLALSLPLIKAYGVMGGAWVLVVVQCASIASMVIYLSSFNASNSKTGQ